MCRKEQKICDRYVITTAHSCFKPPSAKLTKIV